MLYLPFTQVVSFLQKPLANKSGNGRKKSFLVALLLPVLEAWAGWEEVRPLEKGARAKR